MAELELKFTTDPEGFNEALMAEDFTERMRMLPNLTDLAICEIVRYGIRNDAGMIRDLQDFYAKTVVRMPEDQRTVIFQHVKGMVENTTVVSANAFLPFIVEETSRVIVSSAVIDYVSLAPITDDDPMSRVKDVIGMLENGYLRNDGAAFGGLLFLGDERVCKLLVPIRDSLNPDDIRGVTHSVTGLIQAATAEFYLDWLEGLEGDQVDGQFGLVASGLFLMAQRAMVKDYVRTGHRPFPYNRDAQGQADMRKGVPIEEYRERIARRMQGLERSEPPPRIMPHVLAAWGIPSVTDPAEAIAFDDSFPIYGTASGAPRASVPEGEVAQIKHDWWDGVGRIFAIWGILNPNGPTLYALGEEETEQGGRTYFRWMHMLGGETTFASRRRREGPTLGTLTDDVREIANWLAQNDQQGLFTSIPDFVIAADGDERLASFVRMMMWESPNLDGQNWGRFVAYQRQFKTDFFAAAGTQIREYADERRSELILQGQPLDEIKMIEARFGHLPEFQTPNFPAYEPSGRTRELESEWWSTVSQPAFAYAALGTLRVMWEGAYGLVAPMGKVDWNTIVGFLDTRFPLPPPPQ